MKTKMNITLRVKLLMVALLATIVSNAQVTVSTSQLNGTEWQQESICVNGRIAKDSTIITTIKFDMTSYVNSAYFSRINKNSCLQYPYYISDKEPSYTYFDSSKVGVNNVGKYIVYYNDKLNEVLYETIISFNDDEMVLFHKALDDYDVYVTYKRVKKDE